MKKALKEYIFIHIGLFLVALAIHYFLAPNKFAPGGISGLSIVINHIVPTLSVGTLMAMMNVLLFVLGFIFIGPDFGFRTIYSSFVLSAMVWMMDKFYPITVPLSHEKFIQLIFGISLYALGIAIVFHQNGSTGGTDIIAKIINKYLYINLGQAILFSDLAIAFSATYLFGIEIGMYAIIGVFINGMMIDYVLQGFNISKEVVIISKCSDNIKEFIVVELGRGATVHYAKGAYTNDEKEVITTILGRREFIRLTNFINGIDKGAFITVNNMSETFGGRF